MIRTDQRDPLPLTHYVISLYTVVVPRSDRRVWLNHDTNVSRNIGKRDDAEDKKDMVADGSVIVRDDLDSLLEVLPVDIRDPVACHPQRTELLEVVLDLGRRPEARFLGGRGGEYLREELITKSDLEHAMSALGDFGGDNRAGVRGLFTGLVLLGIGEGMWLG
eukprot:jgi/Picre1/28490/NNA_003894.t1